MSEYKIGAVGWHGTNTGMYMMSRKIGPLGNNIHQPCL